VRGVTHKTTGTSSSGDLPAYLKTKLERPSLGSGLATYLSCSATNSLCNRREQSSAARTISHRAGTTEESPPVQIEGFRTELDKRPQARRLSPQALVQEYLNNSDPHLWGVVTNGCLLRLLRDTSRTSRPSYLEFDLQSILEGNRFNEFALFYRVCHRTRLPRTAEDATSCWLEKYFQLSIEQGGRVRDKLRDGVEEALKTLGTGFLRHPENSTLREHVKAGSLTPAEFHRQLLRLVYRLLFLMVAEERRMIVPEGPEADRRQSLYDRYYSVGRLRTLAEKPIESSTFGDLWIGLLQTFRLFEDGDSNPLGVPPLNGDLFSAVAVKDLQGTNLLNDVLLAAMQRLSLFEDHRVRQKVNYSALDVEELGSVYESLLDFQPAINEQPEGISFELRIGSDRKSTGSYYTRPELVRELIESALVPVMQDRLAAAKDSDPAKEKEKKQQAILSMCVCDPACGSGHFLLAAARRLGRELAKIKTGEDEPTPKEFHLAVRDVIAQCVYGVDVNPLAVDLCKLALWLEGHWTGKPLSFLDHRIKVGNSLIGVLNMDVLRQGVPDKAFDAVMGDDKKVASAFKKSNREQRKGQPSLPFDVAEHVHHYASESVDYAGIAEDSPADVQRKKDAYEKSRQKPDWWHDWVAANLWTAAFFFPLTEYNDPVVPTHDKFMAYLRDKHVDGQMQGAAIGLASLLRFFHWALEFPAVFEEGGFDVVIGNPPWERTAFEEKPFFALRAPEIAEQPTTAARADAIARLKEKNPKLFSEYTNAKRAADTENKFYSESTRYPYGASGRLNLFALFAEIAQQLIKPVGRVGVIVQTSIATDSPMQKFWNHMSDSRMVVSVLDFENRNRLFPDVHSNAKFCLLTLTGSAKPVQDTQFAFYLHNTADLLNKARVYRITPKELAVINPNTRQPPLCRTRVDLQLLTKIQEASSILYDESARQLYQAEGWRAIMSATGSRHYKSQGELVTADKHNGYCYRDSQSIYLPLIESKMIHQFDHRYATFTALDGSPLAGVNPRVISGEEKNLFELGVPKFWAAKDFVEVMYESKDWTSSWIVGYRDVTNSTNERTSIACVLPRVGLVQPLNGVTVRSARHAAYLVAALCSIPLDYVCRLKVPWTHLNVTIFSQLPVPRLEEIPEEIAQAIIEASLELTFTSSSLSAFADDLNYRGPCFAWDEKRREWVRAQLDAYFAHLYRLTRDELRYILDPKDVFGEDFPSETFRVLKEREQKEFGEYRSRRFVLEAFDKLAESPTFREEMGRRQSAIDISGSQLFAAH